VVAKVLRKIRSGVVKRVLPVAGWFIDHPLGTNLVIVAVVLTHFSVAWFLPIANFWTGVFPTGSEPVDITLALVGAGALLAGFAGVVVVFGLQNNSERFRRLRRQGGDELTENWSSMSSSGFWTMGIALVAALAFSAQVPFVGALLLEASLLVLMHGSVRLIWMLRRLIDVVSADDDVADRKDRTAVTDSMPFMKKGGR
jgi:hypothetical protein